MKKLSYCPKTVHFVSRINVFLLIREVYGEKVGFILFIVTVSSSMLHAGRGLLGDVAHAVKKGQHAVKKVQYEVKKAPKAAARAVSGASSSGRDAALLFGALVGAGVHEEQQRRDAQRRRDEEARRDAQRKRDALAAQDRQERLEREHAQRLKDQALQDLSDDYDAAQQSIGQEDRLIKSLEQEHQELEGSLENKESEIESWEQGDNDRQQNLASLQQQLDAAKKAYAQRWEQSQGDYERQLCIITSQGATQLHEVCVGQAEERNGWPQALEQEEKTVNQLQTQKESLLATKEEKEHALVDAVVQAIVGKHARSNDVLRAVKLVGGDREILRAAQQLQDVSFFVDLIMSGKFKVADLSTVAGNKAVPKSFFRAAWQDLYARTESETAVQPASLSEWLAQLERFGHRKFFCCYC